MSSKDTKPDAVSREAAVGTEASPWDTAVSISDSDDESDESDDDSVEEEDDAQDPDLSSDEDRPVEDDAINKKVSELLRSTKGSVGKYDRRRGAREEEEAPDDITKANIRSLVEAIEDPEAKFEEQALRRYISSPDNPFDFPKDRERWSEEDLGECWAIAPVKATQTGWDPAWVDKRNRKVIREELECGPRPRLAPFYVPYYKSYPIVPPDDFCEIITPEDVIEELDLMEEFLTWASYIFKDGSSYEGTVWNDQAHGKGVYVADRELVRYEGEWLQNLMDGHGVAEVDIPDIQPRPGSKLEAQMRAQGKIIKRDFMSPDDQKWLAMDIKDTLRFQAGASVVPFYEKNTWIKLFGKTPEKGRYRYSGQWKHGRMHGCGVYEVNNDIFYGQFYFGEYLKDSVRCGADISMLHAGIAEVAAAKARMFANKPDGMVREKRGPYGDPQHPYFYEEEDVWMAPGFVNQFYETPDYWKTYVEEVDQEREMWLNSFYKSPLRIPMPAELEYWWETDESPEFVLINKEPERDPEDPSKLVYTEDPLILHTRTGRVINYVNDEKYGIRLFWQPFWKGKLKDVDPDELDFLPLGFDEFYGLTEPAGKDTWLVSLIKSFQNAIKPKLEQIEKWVDEKKKASELKLRWIDHGLDLVEAEICLEEETKELDAELKRKQKEDVKKVSQMDLDESLISSIREADSDEEDDDEGEETASTFDTAPTKMTSKDNQKGRHLGKSPFSSLSMSFGTFASVTQVPKKFLGSFLSRSQGSRSSATRLSSSYPHTFQAGHSANASSVSYPRKIGQSASLRAVRNKYNRPYTPMQNNLECLVSKTKFSRNDSWHGDHGFWDLERHPLCVLSLYVPLLSP